MCTVPFAYLEMKDEERADQLMARFVEAARATAHGGVRIEWSPWAGLAPPPAAGAWSTQCPHPSAAPPALGVVVRNEGGLEFF